MIVVRALSEPNGGRKLGPRVLYRHHMAKPIEQAYVVFDENRTFLHLSSHFGCCDGLESVIWSTF